MIFDHIDFRLILGVEDLMFRFSLLTALLLLPTIACTSDTGLTGVLSEADFAQLHQLTDRKRPDPKGHTVRLGEGSAYLSVPEGAGPFSAVLLIHEWWGLNDHIRHQADRLAADGYVALAIDLYGGQVATTRDEAMALMKGVEDGAAHAVLSAGWNFLASDAVKANRRGVIGWCFGGGWSLQHVLATPDVDAGVIFYGRLNTDPKALARIQAPLLGVFGNRDQGIPVETVDEFEAALTEAGVIHEIHRFDAEHAFANPSSAHYDDISAAAAWEKVREFLALHLRQPKAAEVVEAAQP